MHHIATITSTSQTQISFTSIPQTFTHLQLRISARSSIAVNGHDLNMTTNLSSGSNYTNHVLAGDGATASSNVGYGTPSTLSLVSWVPGANLASGIFGSSIIDIVDYTDTTKNKTFKTISGYDANGSGQVNFMSGMVMNTGAINAIYFFVGGGGGNIVSGSSFNLYGIASNPIATGE
jgi:hypothetical protein